MEDIRYLIKYCLTYLPMKWSAYQSIKHMQRFNTMSRWLND